MPSVWTDGEDSTSQGLHTFIHLRYVEDWGGRGGSSGVTAARERFNWLATTKSVENIGEPQKSVDNPGAG